VNQPGYDIINSAYNGYKLENVYKPVVVDNFRKNNWVKGTIRSWTGF